MRISDWSSDVCSSDLLTAQIVDDMTDTGSDKRRECAGQGSANIAAALLGGMGGCAMIGQSVINVTSGGRRRLSTFMAGAFLLFLLTVLGPWVGRIPMPALVAVMIMVSIGTFSRSEEHTSELQSLMRISSAVFCLKKKKITTQHKK